VSFEQQNQALRAGRGFVELSSWTTIAVTGADRLPFLHSFCTNDVKRLTVGQSAEAFFTNVKGKTIGQGWIFSLAAEALIIGPPGQGPRLVEHLDRYVIREDVQLQDVSHERKWLFVSGVNAPGVAALKWPVFGLMHGALVAAAQQSSIPIRQTLVELGFMECDASVLNAARIESGTPLFGVDFGDDNFPQEVGRDREAISFTKGCYLGQETVARIDALGHVNQRIVGVKLDGLASPPAGLDLTHGEKSVGRITSAAFSPVLHAQLGLAMVRKEHTAAGSRLESAVGTWEVVELPVG
jgi:folate-binding protein YgfZ